MIKNIKGLQAQQLALLIVVSFFAADRLSLYSDIVEIEGPLIAKSLITLKAGDAHPSNVMDPDFEGGENFEDDYLKYYTRSENPLEVSRLIELCRESCWSIPRSANLSAGRRFHFINRRAAISNLPQTFSDMDVCDRQQNLPFLLSIQVDGSELLGDGLEVYFSDLTPIWDAAGLGWCFDIPGLYAYWRGIGAPLDFASSAGPFDERIYAIAQSRGLLGSDPAVIYESLRNSYEQARLKVPVLGVDISYFWALLVIFFWSTWNNLGIASLSKFLEKAIKEGSHGDERYLALDAWLYPSTTREDAIFQRASRLISIALLLVFVVTPLVCCGLVYREAAAINQAQWKMISLTLFILGLASSAYAIRCVHGAVRVGTRGDLSGLSRGTLPPTNL